MPVCFETPTMLMTETLLARRRLPAVKGKTVIAIAHRLSTIAAMDRLIVLDQGRIVEEGDHRSLLANGGLYARLWAHQSGGFLADRLEDSDTA